MNHKLTKEQKAQAKALEIKSFTAFCISEGLPEPRPEYQFHPVRKWRIDWYFEANGYMVALEVEGGAFSNIPVRCNHCHQTVTTKTGKTMMMSGGRHNTGEGFIGDMEKYNALTMMGIFILRVQPKNLMKLDTLKMVKAVLEI